MFRIYTKKAFCFQNPNVGNIAELNENQLREALVHTRPMDFCEVPDWVEQDAMFKWALADGDISILEEKVFAGGAPTTSTSGTEDLSKMKALALYKLCLERGIECEERQSREHYIQLLTEEAVAGEGAGEDQTEE